MNNATIRHASFSGAAVAFLCLSAGCASHSGNETFVPGTTVPSIAPSSFSELEGAKDVSWSIPTYKLMPGDSVDILYNLEYRLTGQDYELDILDKFHITVLNHEEVNGDYQVRPDGKITLPYVGSIQVTGLTVDKLSESLRNAFSDRFQDPQIFINLTQFGARIEELKKMISSDRRGQIFEARVRPDGYITLPIVGDLYAAGRTAAALNEVVKIAYEPHYKAIDVSTIVRDTPSNVYYVLGEVAQPGQFEFSSPRTLTQALARAGVMMDTAGLKTVVVVNTSTPKPVGRVFNVAALFSGDEGTDALLGRDDVVFVPKSAIAEADLWVAQYIERLLLFRGSSFSYSVGKRL